MYRKFEFTNRDPKYQNEVYGYLELDPETDDGRLYFLDDYTGLHAGRVYSMYRKAGYKVLDKWEFKKWLSLRVCPPGRHNIKDILKSFDMDEYSASKLYIENQGKNTRDNMMLRELPADTDIQELLKKRNSK